MDKKTTTAPKGINLNKAAYTIFLLAGIAFLIANNLSQAVIFWGLALVFDPFDVKLPFSKRPFYQKAWLVVHLAITLSLFAVEIVGDIRK